MNTKLFCCPLCGNRAELRHEHGLTYITCVDFCDCGASTGMFQDEQCAVDSWNTRHDIPRASVQAAVDEIKSSRKNDMVHPQIRGVIESVFYVIRRHTGVVQSGVKDSLTDGPQTEVQ